jgi:hypothetical protein
MFRSCVNDTFVTATPRLGFPLCLAHPKRPLWSGDKLEEPDIVLGLVGEKEALGPTTETGADQNPLEDATGDLLPIN